MNTHLENKSATLRFSKIMFLGRTLEEYEAFFNIKTSDYLAKPVLDVAAACASFTCQANALGVPAVSIDPLYGRSLDALKQLAKIDFTEVLEKMKESQQSFDLTYHQSFKAFIDCRLQARKQFEDDYETAFAQGRYLRAALPKLPFNNDTFALALCGHLLFLYEESLDYTFHLAAVQELCRVAQEVRIYPLCNLQGELYSQMDPLRRTLERSGIASELISVDYQVLKGSQQTLVLHRTSD